MLKYYYILVVLALLQTSCESGAEKTQKPTLKEAEGVILQRSEEAIELSLPGELKAFEEVKVYPKITGFVKEIRVDRGTKVKKGDIIAVLEAPEIIAQLAEAKAKVSSAESKAMSEELNWKTSKDTYERIHKASLTPGAISANELIKVKNRSREDSARWVASLNDLKAARAYLNAANETSKYLQIKAPFDGLITERNVHTGALVNVQGSENELPLFKMEANEKLRLEIALPENFSNTVLSKDTLWFSVGAYPGEIFHGILNRQASSISVRTRTEMIEADVFNSEHRLKAGMFAQVKFRYKRPENSFLVPASAVVSNMEDKFVETVKNGRLQRVTVREGVMQGNKVEVFGSFKEGDSLLLRGSDEYKNGDVIDLKIR
ncbi:efflux RND transporter periplasmic adaptor subunit [Cytophagaceae bacterium ABcell3]|nr:efflux RND transporter periplasmic adaptor subunit [Cytophagaceae bacterium ABcell3]